VKIEGNVGYIVGVRLDSGHLNVEFNAPPGLSEDEAFDLALNTIEHELGYAKVDWVTSI
jgi:hypothetical protein